MKFHSIFGALKNIGKQMVQLAGSVILCVLEVCIILGAICWFCAGDASLFLLSVLVTILWLWVVHEFADTIAFIAASIPGGEKIFGISPDLIRKGEEVREKRKFLGRDDNGSR